jgi:FkbH-like protein
MLNYFCEDRYLRLRHSEMLQGNESRTDSSVCPERRVFVLSNITVSQIYDPLSCILHMAGLDFTVRLGNYDNIFQDSTDVQSGDVVIVFWEICNLIPDFYNRIYDLNPEQVSEVVASVKASLNAVLHNLGKAAIVIFNEFTSAPFVDSISYSWNLDFVAKSLNEYLFAELSLPNLVTVSLDKIFSILSLSKCIDFRFFYLGKALYSFEFYKHYCNEILPYINSVGGVRKKAIVFDLDNTLWKGVLGEDGFDRIEMSPRTPQGQVFYEIQSMALRLAKAGVIVGLCSKNNLWEVQQVLSTHPDQQLRGENLSIIKCNWQEKPENLLAIASELNIGLDSIIFIDDSSYETELVQRDLPMIDVMTVPKNIFEFPFLLKRKMRWFWQKKSTVEDQHKASYYQQASLRAQFRDAVQSLESYLEGLSLRMKVSRNDADHVTRIAQLCQKTNQFNVRPVRYVEEDISGFMRSATADVFDLSVSDKFGPSGLTGVCIVKYSESGAFIDSFLLSCRIIGRNFEFQFIQYILDEIQKRGSSLVSAEFLRTERNMQVTDFFEKCCFQMQQQSMSATLYSLALADWSPAYISYIELEQ